MWLKEKRERRDFLGGPMVKTLPPNASGVGSIPGREAKFPHPTCLMAKNQNIKQKQYYNNVVTIQKTLKMVHIKKKKA